MKRRLSFFLACLASAALVSSAHAVIPPGWSTNLIGALAGFASSTQQTQAPPVLVYFTASWCGPCKMMARTTLTNETVLQTLAPLTRIAVDIDEQAALAERFEIRAVPTFLLLAPSGEPTATTTGYQDPETFVTWLTNGINEAKTAMARKAEVERKLTEIDQWLKGNDPDTWRRAATELAELCGDRNEVTSRSAVERLTVLAQRDPLLPLELLNHPRLAVRIHVANLLRKQLRDSFSIDPWSDALTRTNNVIQWREKLARGKR